MPGRVGEEVGRLVPCRCRCRASCCTTGPATSHLARPPPAWALSRDPRPNPTPPLATEALAATPLQGRGARRSVCPTPCPVCSRDAPVARSPGRRGGGCRMPAGHRCPRAPGERPRRSQTGPRPSGPPRAAPAADPSQIRILASPTPPATNPRPLEPPLRRRLFRPSGELGFTTQRSPAFSPPPGPFGPLARPRSAPPTRLNSIAHSSPASPRAPWRAALAPHAAPAHWTTRSDSPTLSGSRRSSSLHRPPSRSHARVLSTH